jgi:hypothetical protein
MLLMDRVNELTLQTRMTTGLDGQLSSAVRFRLDEKAQTFIDSIAMDGDRLRSQASHLFWPGPHVWFEWAHPRGAFGVRFFGDREDIHVGTMNLWFWPRGAAVPIIGMARCDLKRRVPVEIVTVKNATPDAIGRMRKWLSAAPAEIEATEHVETVSTILAILSLMNSPRLVRSTDISRTKLNTHRMRGGKFPLLAYSEVSVDLGKHDISTLILDTDGARRALHWVRAHLRFRMGQWEIVKPHWRGDPSIGIKRPAYRLTHNSD